MSARDHLRLIAPGEEPPDEEPAAEIRIRWYTDPTSETYGYSVTTDYAGKAEVPGWAVSNLLAVMAAIVEWMTDQDTE